MGIGPACLCLSHRKYEPSGHYSVCVQTGSAPRKDFRWNTGIRVASDRRLGVKTGKASTSADVLLGSGRLTAKLGQRDLIDEFNSASTQAAQSAALVVVLYSANGRTGGVRPVHWPISRIETGLCCPVNVTMRSP